MKSERTKQRLLKAAIIFLSIVAFIVSVGLGYFLRIALIGKDSAALEEVAAYLRTYGVFNTQTLELEDFSGEDAAKLITEGVSDNYAEYYSKDEFDEIKNTHSGNYRGVGISVYTSTLEVAKVVINSPAFYAGVKPADLLVSASDFDGNKVVFSGLADFNNFLAGLSGNSFTLEVLRDGASLNIDMVIAEYKATYLMYYDSDSQYAYVGKDETSLTKLEGSMPELAADSAYVSFDTFEGDAAKELKGMLSLMKSKNKTKLVLDLRNNGGGYMDVLEDFAGGLIYKDGESRLPVAFSKNNKGSFKEFKTSSSFYNTDLIKIVVIANEKSASATECLIGAMLYYGGAFSIDNLIIENDELSSGVAKTYGKGIMQTTFMLSNGGGIKLTTAVIYQPDKTTCIHNKGITVSGSNAVAKSDNAAISRAVAILAS